MRQFFPVFIFLFASVQCWAQVTITQDDMPQLGTSYYTVQAPIFDQGDPESLAGPDFFWDYNDLGIAATDSVAYASVSEVPLQYQLIFNNPFSNSYANRALAIDGFGAGGMEVPLEDAHQFFLVDDDGFYDCGYAATFNELPLFGERNPTDRIFVLPLTYGMPADTSESFFEVDIPTMANVKSYQTRTNTLDAWGTVVTPSGSYEALRVRSVVNGVDSITIEAFGLEQVVVRPETVEYRWVSPEMGVPVLQINTTEGEVSEIRYRLEEEEVGLATKTERIDVSLYPNPAADVAHIDLPANFSLTSIYLFDTSGKQVSGNFSISENQVKINAAAIPNGLYRAVLLGENQQLTSWLVVNH